MSNETVQLILAIAQIVTAIATLILAWVAFRVTKQIARANYERTFQDLCNLINTTALSNEESLKASECLFSPNVGVKDVESLRKKWLSFIVLNSVQATYLGMQDKLMNREYAERILKQILHPLLEDEDTYNLIQERGYNPKFAQYCEQERAKLLKAGSTGE